ncbi:MAG: cytidylate kinase-like family protein [Parabacteroides sp.]|jgi:cytidylate kinase|nr:cytidylate kinase-like family protein [Parabacteroides sp.]MBP8759918.1 cytidylate kinase-like family protein [Parabacteroides sp.]MBP9480378.1 cytidylate kinase-like family protein [Parabacteroides sp.]MBP9578801.1 cytidylate kinase-like family protein [Parabacteroides sp.]MDD3357815.1 cytidylate kinase-like family protein [Parabacteroides sp.]
MENKIVVTIGRQFGSGGREIGKKLAELLGIAYYDKELMAFAARESGLCKEFFEKADEKVSGNLSYAFSLGYSYMGAYAPYNDILSNDGLFKLQSDAIRNLADKQSCVLVGRCADYILRNDPACISVFIHNKLENRIQRIMQNEKVTEQEAKEKIASIDKSRASYYNYYTNKAWGVASSYDLSVDASVLGIDETVLFIKSFVMKRLELASR